MHAHRLISRMALASAGSLLAVLQGLAAARAAELPQVLTGVNARFDGANLPVVTGNKMVINQVADKATLHWQSFNVGAGHSVEFKQPGTSSVALNRIFDAAPSQVRGQITANGQVYLINANGIVFATGAKVDTQSLVASTLDISDQVFQDIGFVNAINAPGGAIPAFDSMGRPMGEIRIEQGAALESAKGGRILVFAPTIVNAGTISTPEGQQVLAAAKDRVLIAASGDPNLRGLLVEVSTGGDVTNVGSLIAERGNITLLGLAVNQDGVARATTGVALNGSVRLLAQDMNGTLALGNNLVPRVPKPTRGGDLVLGAGSVTEVVPDRARDDKGNEILALDAQTQSRSQAVLVGSRIELESGARLTATGGDIDITAAADPFVPDFAQPGDPAVVPARVTVREGAVIDAAGDQTTSVSVSRNVVSVEARGNELADAPLQRNGPIRNKTLRVDLRKGTGFLNTEGPVAAIGRTAAERQSVGGSIRVRSEGAFVLEQGARVDVSGGAVNYTTDTIRTSQLQQVNGQVVDIASADPNVPYVGLAADNVRVEPGYREGKDAGQVTLQARGITLAGSLAAGSTPGPNQRFQPADLAGSGTPAFARPFDQTPLGGALAISLLQSGLPELAVGAAPPSGPAPALTLSAEFLRQSGASRLGLVNVGPVTVRGTLDLPAWSNLTLVGTSTQVLGTIRSPGGTVSLASSNALVEGFVPDAALLTRIDGTVDLSGVWVNDSPLVNGGSRSTATVVVDGGRLEVRSGAAVEVTGASRLDVSGGAWLASDGTLTGGRGGTIRFATGAISENPLLGAPLRIGGELRAFGVAGGGTLGIVTERIEIVADAAPAGDLDVLLNGASQFGLRTVTNSQGTPQFLLQVAGSTFQRGGFGAFELQSTRADLAILPGAVLPVRTAQFLLGDRAAVLPTGTPFAALATTAFAPDFARPPARLSLAVTNELGDPIGGGRDLSLADGASIVADAGSTVALSSVRSLFVDGSIAAPAGRIDLLVKGGPPVFLADQQIWLGDTARLSVDAVALINDQNPQRLRFGEVLDAGVVSVRASQGSIIGAAGARIAANGTTAVLDIGAGYPLPALVAGAAGSIELRAAEALLYTGGLSAAAPAGTSVRGGRLLVSVDPGERGTEPLLGVDGIPRGPHRIVVEDFNGPLPGRGQAISPSVNSTAYVPLAALRSGGFAALDLVARSSAVSFDDVTAIRVPDTRSSVPIIEFRQDLDLSLPRSIVLDTAVLQTTGARVSLSAPYVAIGYADTQVQIDGSIPDAISTTNPQNNTLPLRLTPTTGSGLLTVSGDLVELVGDTATLGFGNAAAGTTGVQITTGDLRLRGVRKSLGREYGGVFRTAGNLDIEATRVYPTTLTKFELTVEGAGGQLALRGGADPSAGAPLSVGGVLGLNADRIVQGTGLYAPLGRLDFNAATTLQFTAGSLTSVSAVGVRAPFFRTEPGGSLVLPAPSTNDAQIVFVNTVENPLYERLLPSKRVGLTAPVVELAPGSQFDLRGGSDITATEFVPGPGGSRDILLADLDRGAGVLPNESFAVLPVAGAFAPYDPLETPDAKAVQGLRIGDTVLFEDGIDGLPAGEYAILPARYALYGGYLVTPTGLRDVAPGQGLQRTDGIPIVAGRFGVAGSAAADSRSQGFAVETGAQVRQRAEYLETPLDAFYGSGGVRRPTDAGNLVVSAGSGLTLQGELIRQGAASGLGSTVDIATASAIRVVTDFSGLPGIELRARDLENLGADSLLLGGTRSATTDGLTLGAASSEVSVDAGVDLELPELILLGRRVSVGEGAATTRLASTAPRTDRATTLRVDADAALLAVSGQRLSVERGVDLPAGQSDVVVGPNASVQALGSVVLDAVRNIDLSGSLAVTGGALGLGAGRISLGETGGRGLTSGLVLDNAALAGLAGADLRLRSRQVIDLYGSVQDPATGEPLAFRALVLDAPGLRGLDNGGVVTVLNGSSIELRNGSGLTAASGAAGEAGSGLDLRASGVVTVAAPAFAIQGIADTRLDAGQALLFATSTSLAVDGNLAIEAPVIAAGQAVRANLRVAGDLQVGAGDAAAAPPAGAGLGATIDASAASIDFNGRVVLPSGTLRLAQVGDAASPRPGAGLRLGGAASIDVAGRSVKFGPRTVASPGGLIELIADTGDLGIAAGARLDVSGAAGGGEAGEVRLVAAAGTVSLAAGARLVAADPDGGRSGRFSLDAGGLANPGGDAANPLTGVASLLATAGFRDRVALRLRQQDLELAAGSTIKAREIRLVSDTGNVAVAGQLDASGEQGGQVWLAAGDRVDLSGTILARASAAGARGGRVDLYALDVDADDGAGARDTVDFRAGGLIDVSGGAGGPGGRVFLHTRRLDSDGNGQTDRVVQGELDGIVTGAESAQLVATRVLRNPNASFFTDPSTGAPVARVTIGTSQIDAWRNETATFMASLAAPSVGGFVVAPGLQVDSTGELILQNRWDFEDGWHFGRDLGNPADPQPGQVGVLTLRAGRILDLRADLTDGFAEQLLFGFLPIDAVTGAVQRLDAGGNVVGEVAPTSWSYRLTAGADLASADVLGTAYGRAAELRVGTGARVRTGSGDIDLSASGDVRLQNDAAVYTAGWDRGLSAQLQAAIAASTTDFGLTAYDFFGTFLNGGQFPVAGGTVSILAGGSLRADTAPAPVTSWLTRIGSGVIGEGLYSASDGFGAVPTHWGVVFSQFRNGVGAFGGGDLQVNVRGGVTNVALALPTAGRAVDGVVANTDQGLIVFLPSQRTTETLGGGNLRLRADGSVLGSQVTLGRGQAVVRSGGDARAQLLVGGDAEVVWNAGGNLQLTGLQDPTVRPLDASQLVLLQQLFANISSVANINNAFYTYTDASRVRLGSTAGNVVFDGPAFSDFLPPSLTAVAFGGDINVVATPLDFFPAPSGQLELLARRNVTGNFIGSTEARLRQSDQDRATLSSVDRPDILSAPLVPARSPVRAGDARPNVIVALDGSVQSQPGRPGFWNLELAKSTLVQAGLDIRNLFVRVQNIGVNDLTSFQAGRDIIQPELRTPVGRFDPSDRRIFEIWGPGSAEFVAARNISLGTSAGIETIGNTRNPALVSQGAALRLLAGTGGEPSYDRFIEVYLSSAPSEYRDRINAFLADVDAGREGFATSAEGDRSLPIQPGEYRKDLVKFLADRGIPLVDGDPVATFQALDRPRQREFLSQVLFAELKDWGSASETASRADRLNYVRGYTAIDTLFAITDPLADRAGGFAPGEVQSAVQDFLTITDNQAANDAQVELLGAFFPQRPRQGDINLLLSQVQTLAGGSLSMLAPGGDINAGAADADVIAKEPADLGIVTALPGDIDIFVDNDLLVNSTRVFALQGDLLLWSSNGNIDAGKGAKTVTSVPDPITSIDPNTGDTIIEFPPAVAGSGLQGRNAALFAPRGAVNAGDAGIRTSGDLTIGAIQVIGTDNISVGGLQIGFSTSDAVAVAPPAAAAATAAASQGLDAQGGLLGDEDQLGERLLKGTEVNFIRVDVLGFGSGRCDPGDEDCD